MKTLLKFAMGAAIAGALVNLLLKQMSGDRASASRGERFASAGDADTETMDDTNTVADTNTVGDAQQERGPQPQDWRGAQNVLDS
jgi:hypothetical protein